MPSSVSAIRNAEHAVDAADRTPDAGTDCAADCAAHRPCRTMTLVRALVGTALHTVEDTLSMRLMRYGE
jgi:Tfp pilus assembly protein PilX